MSKPNTVRERIAKDALTLRNWYAGLAALARMEGKRFDFYFDKWKNKKEVKQ